jgi:hypothetical protein
MVHPITQVDLDLIGRCANQPCNDADHAALKKVYEKLYHICMLLRDKGYITEIRRDPRRQAGPGTFLFQEYQWARIYPANFYDAAQGVFAYIIGLSDTLHFHMMGIKEHQHEDASTLASQTSWTDIDFEGKSYEQIVDEFIAFDKRNRKLFIATGAKFRIPFFTLIQNQMRLQEVVQLLKYKKQIILQGPPGTGKTRLANELARAIARPSQITQADILRNIRVDQIVKSKEGTAYRVESVDPSGVKLKLENGATQTRTLQNVIDAYTSFIEGRSLTGGDTYQTAVAKYIAENWDDSEQIKLVQFHPSYSYEDFVRGIVAVPNEDGDGVLYEAENKVLAQMAEDALSSYWTSKLVAAQPRKELITRSDLERFVDYVQEQIEISADQKYMLTPEVYIFFTDDKRFKYKGDNWTAHNRGLNLRFSELEKLIAAGVTERKHIKDVSGIGSLTRHHATYYFETLKKFRQFLKDNPAVPPKNPIETRQKTPKNYVLIIDEINRANLSSVLGELIYALEYRGEAVESMYAIDGDNRLTLPLNLYIIGTMNTADRSVGHIDYAIRRRFAFVDVVPKELSDTDFDVELFRQVSALFVKEKKGDMLVPSDFLSSEFKPQDVWLGHSYFIRQTDVDMQVRLKYEILPILEEYIKDGVLIESDQLREAIAALKATVAGV